MRKNNLMFLVFVVGLFIISKPATAINVDSLKNVAITLKDSTQAETYGLIAKYYITTNKQFDSCLKYNNLAFISAEKSNSIFRMIKSKLNIAHVHSLNNDFKQVEIVLKEAHDIANKRKYSKGLIDIYNFYGYMYGMRNDLEKSAFYFINTAKEYEKLKDFKNLALTYKNICALFYTQDQYDKMIEYTNKYIGLIHHIKLPDEAETIVSLYSGAAQYYLYVYEKNQDENYLKKALQFSDTCLVVSNKYSISRGVAEAYYIKCNYSKINKNHKEAIKYGKKGLEYRNSTGDDLIFNFLHSISGSYLELGDLTNAKLYLDSCNLSEVSKMSDYTKSLAELEYALYKKSGDSDKALIALEKLVIENKKLQNSERNSTINELEGKYQSELKEAKINELNQKAEIDSLRIRSLIAISIGAILVILIVFFMYRQNATRNKLQTIEIEQRLNRARMDPHFFFNALSSLQGLANDDHRRLQVSDYISNFAKIMRQSLESSYSETQTIEDEIDFLTNYMELQKLRTGNKFNFSFEVEPSLEINELLIPGMILQPFIENSIEHGFLEIQDGGVITISFEMKNKDIKISIIDNGSGIKNDTKHKTYPSRAIQIIKDRLYLLNRKYKTKANFELSQIESGGTKVEIILPVIERNENTSYR